MKRSARGATAGLGLLLLLGAPAGAQDELGEAEARAVAHRFLTRGPLAPRPRLEERAFARALSWRESQEEARPVNRGRCFHFRMPPERESPMQFSVAVSPRGQVVSYLACDRSLKVSYRDGKGRKRSEAEREEERRARTRFDAGQLRRRAKWFLAWAYPGFLKRRFRVRAEESEFELTSERRIRYEEEVRPGLLAVYPNRIIVVLSPETGQVVRYHSTCVPEVVREDASPPVGAAGARRRALLEKPGHRVVSCELWLIIKRNRARPVWLVETRGEEEEEELLLVSADDGSLLLPQETLE